MRHTSGFTLIEVLVSLSLLGILLVLIGGSITSANRSLHSASGFAARLDQTRAAQRFLRESLHKTLPLTVTAQAEHAVAFDGSARQMRFVAPVPAGLGGQLKVQQIESLRTAEGELQLRVGFVEREHGQAWGQPQVLLGHLRSIHFAYQGEDEQRQPTDWLPQWPWPERLPKQVRIEAESEGPIRWPSLTVMLRNARPQG